MAAAGEKPKKAGGKKKVSFDSGPSTAKRSKGEGKAAAKQAAAEQEEEVAEASINLKGQLVRDLAVMMYGFGDDADPLPESLDLVEDIVLEYLGGVLHRAMDCAAQRGRLRRSGAGAGASVLAEDVLHLMQNDPRKYARVKELLLMSEEINRAKKLLDTAAVDAAPAAAAAAAADVEPPP